MKRLKKLIIILLILAVAGELAGRFVLGLGDMPIYIEDDDYEYIFAPNQEATRFGNVIRTNEYSMRSAPLSDNDKTRVLKIGDSIINGGNHVDQDSLATTMMEQDLQEWAPNTRVLNISAGSWGPDNAFAYINKHGHFDASMMVLVFSSHDLHDNRHFRKVVGKHPSWPGEKPMLALTDGFFRYVWPKIAGSEDEYAYLDGFDDSAVNPGWDQFYQYTQQHDIDLLVYLHPEQEEVENGSYNADGQQIIATLESNGINYILGLEHAFDATHYRDNIHLNAAGQKKLKEALYPYVHKHVESKLSEAGVGLNN